MAQRPDAMFSHQRLAATYDVFEGERDDLDHYESIVDEFGARTVLDIGCGTGEFACRLARRGLAVVGVDPATASLDIARAKPDAHPVTWIDGDATTLPRLAVDLAVMTGNVAQVFLTDEDWAATLEGIAEALRPDGLLVFETRDPSERAWESWTTPDDAHPRAGFPTATSLRHGARSRRSSCRWCRFVGRRRSRTTVTRSCPTRPFAFERATNSTPRWSPPGTRSSRSEMPRTDPVESGFSSPASSPTDGWRHRCRHRCRHVRPGADITDQSFRRATSLMRWSLSLRMISDARSRVGAMFSRRLRPLMLAHICRAVISACSSVRPAKLLK